MHLARNARSLGQPQIVTIASLPLLKQKHTHHAGAGGGNRESVKPKGLIEVRLDHQNDAGFRGRARYRSVAGGYSKLVPAGRQIVINRGSATRYNGPLRIESFEFVLKLHTTGRPKAAGRKFDFHTSPAGTHPHLCVSRHGLVINSNCFQPDGRVVADPRLIWIEMDGSLHTGEP